MTASRQHREPPTFESRRRLTRTSPGGRHSSHNGTGSDMYTTHSKSYGYGQTHLDRKGSGAVCSDQVKPFLAYTHRPSSSVPRSHNGINPNTSTSKKCMQGYTHCALAQPSPEPVGSSCTATTRKSWQHSQREPSNAKQSARSGR